MKSTKPIVLACENADAPALVENFTSVIVEKVVNAIDQKRKTLAKNLVESAKAKKNEDPYEAYDPKIREAIDYVVERVVDEDLELENCVQMAAKQYNVKEEALTEYFDTFLETTKTEIQVDSTSSDDGDNKRGLRDDEDTNKRVRYESTNITLQDGGTIVLKEGYWETKIAPVLEQLNEENRDVLIAKLSANKASFMKAAAFCESVLKG